MYASSAAERVTIPVGYVYITCLQPGDRALMVQFQKPTFAPEMLTLCGMLQIQLDFAAMQREDPSLLTLKDFVMSSNQAPNSPDAILSLLHAFAEFKQGVHALFVNVFPWHLYGI